MRNISQILPFPFHDAPPPSNYSSTDNDQIKVRRRSPVCQLQAQLGSTASGKSDTRRRRGLSPTILAEGQAVADRGDYDPW